jgi:hypothetical protein
MDKIVLGVMLTVLVIVAQTVLPFAFDFVTTLAVYAAGVVVGRVSKE